MLAVEETEKRRERRIARLKKEAYLPLDKRIEDFNFGRIKGISSREMSRLSQAEFVKRGGNIVFFGPFGVGKTHLTIGLLQALCEQNYRCLFISTSMLIEGLIEAKKELRLSQLWKKMDRYDVIACDELGYIPQTKDGADLFFQLITQRYERRSIIISTNLTYSEWDKVFLNDITTAAAVDRIIHDCETFTIEGPSKRLEDTKRSKEKLTENHERNTKDSTLVDQF